MIGWLDSAGRDWLLGLQRTAGLLRHPRRSAGSLATSWRTIQNAFRLVVEMQARDGVTVPTPKAAPLLITRISGFGDVTLRLDRAAMLSPELLAEHRREVKLALRPLHSAVAQIETFHSLLTSLPLVAGASLAIVQPFGDVPFLLGAFGPALLGVVLSAATAIGFQALVRRLANRAADQIGL